MDYFQCSIRKLVRLSKTGELMVKLTDKQIKYIIEQNQTNKRTTKELSQIYNISQRWIQILVKKYKDTKTYPTMNKSRRPSSQLTENQKEVIIEALEKSNLNGAVTLKLFILKHYKIIIPKNKLHNYLKELGVSKPDKKKQKQRKYCRYERDHSFSLGHMDWHESKVNGKWVCVWIDDASRNIVAGGEFKNANTKNSKKIVNEVLKIVGEVYSSQLFELNTDKGTQFFNSKFNKKGERTFGEFELFLKSKGIKHIPSKRNHPQTNGKNERFFRTYNENRDTFKSFREFINWYNNRIHLGLSRVEGITPNEAIWHKLRKSSVLGAFLKGIE